jgi:AraC family transcriptional regulator
MLQNGTAPASDTNLSSIGRAMNVTPEQAARALPLQPDVGARSVVARGGLAPWQVRRVTEYIETHLASTIRLQDLAGIARLSHSHFCRAFKESVGHPAHAYVMRRRVHRAQGLMLNTVDSLSQIAAQCGMADQAHFCKLFRRLVGESPNAWRRARRQTAV